MPSRARTHTCEHMCVYSVPSFSPSTPFPLPVARDTSVYTRCKLPAISTYACRHILFFLAKSVLAHQQLQHIDTHTHTHTHTPVLTTTPCPTNTIFLQLT
ncbi:hypothetical protein LMJF_02_0155 [Leishmania major strain Friedlin]|uniref:Uncharacterized protein n=1 Tax=Leishmania major TaxID=5664 RepID=E9AC90_LEIMA|nr:hypothetical protein LMJF_02_0155 [Leishmania major strain Friedlin]CAG9567166.1 Vps51/Vps67_-_putative [Leishmania major strain Friedlin]CBZ11905.1 hypothetical protein LMJF_02_0155 [Leishmania major strain Friedlin]|eukprot:XP_003721621.1 hypothetical protein LMJF_02_0155 [Leishmania major strain Friedlin]